MKIGLIDVDGGKKFPNLPLMKLSAWHKAKGDSVEWYDHEKSEHMDIVYMSKVFSFSPDYPHEIRAEKIFGGGYWILYTYKRWERDFRQGGAWRAAA